MLARCAHPDLIGQFQHIGLIFFRVFLSHLLHPFCVLLYHLGCAVLVYHSTFYYGNGYWWEKGIPAQPEDMDAYESLEKKIMEKYDLKEPFEWK